jgi:hypothetical protein
MRELRFVRTRPACVIRCSPPPDKRPTEPLPSFDADEAATAWIAEMRSRQAVRS